MTRLPDTVLQAVRETPGCIECSTALIGASVGCKNCASLLVEFVIRQAVERLEFEQLVPLVMTLSNGIERVSGETCRQALLTALLPNNEKGGPDDQPRP